MATTYEFTVQARDDSYAENTSSFVAASLQLLEQITQHLLKPIRDQVDASPVTIQITATEAADASPVEYQFVNTSGNGPSSDWQTSNVYIASGLSSSTEYYTPFGC